MRLGSLGLVGGVGWLGLAGSGVEGFGLVGSGVLGLVGLDILLPTNLWAIPRYQTSCNYNFLGTRYFLLAVLVELVELVAEPLLLASVLVVLESAAALLLAASVASFDCCADSGAR